MTGPAGNAADSSEAFAGIDSTLLYAALGVVIVILLLTYRSPVLWILPIFSAVVALFCAQAVIYLLARYADLTVNAQSASILTVLVVGAGTDYALLLVARYREELRLHADRHEAMTEAVHRAGPAVLASGGTVILGMLCLLAADMNSTRGLGPVAAIGVGVTLAGAHDPAARAAGHLRPLGVLAGAADAGQRRAHRDRAVGPRGRADPAAAPGRLDRDVRGAAGGLPRPVRPERQGPDRRPTRSAARPSRSWARRWRWQHFPGAAGNPVHVLTSADTADDVAAAVAATDGIATVAEPQVDRRRRADRGDARRRRRQPGRLRHHRPAARRRSTTSGTARRWSAATPPSTSTSRPPRSATTW